MQDGFHNYVFVAIAIIFASDIVYDWYKRKLTFEKKVFGGAMTIFSILAFLFSDVNLTYRFLILIALGTITIVVYKSWPRIEERYLFQSPIVKRKHVEQKKMSIVPQVFVLDHDSLPPWSKIFEQVRSEILIQGITLESLNHYSQSIEDSAKQNKKIKILLCDPEIDERIMNEIENLVVSTDTRPRIKSAMAMINQRRKQLGSNDKSNIEIRIHRKMPTLSLTIIDPQSDAGMMQLEPYPYQIPQEMRKILVINQRDHGDIFEAFHKSFNNLWKDADSANSD